jgi:hypothetical protein
MLARKATVGPSLVSSANNICLSQTPAGAGNLILNGSLVVGGVAVLDSSIANAPVTSQRILFTPAGAEATNGTIWTVTGTDWNGNVATETINGVNNPTTAQSVYDYSTVTQISVNKAQAGAVTVGTNGVASCRPIFLDTFAPAQVAVQVDVTGTVNATVQQTLDDPNGPSGYTAVNWISHPDLNLVGLTGNVQGNYAYLPRCVRILLNSGTGSVTLTLIQADM